MIKKISVFLGKLLCFLLSVAFLITIPSFIYWQYHENMPGPDLDYYCQLAKVDQHYNWYCYKYPYYRTSKERRIYEKELKVIRRWFEAELTIEINKLPLHQQSFAYDMKHAIGYERLLVYTKKPNPKTFKSVRE